MSEAPATRCIGDRHLSRHLAVLSGVAALLGSAVVTFGASSASATIVCSNPTSSELQAALNGCSTVYLGQGTYVGNWTAEAGNVSVIGAAENTTVLKGAGGTTFTANGFTVVLSRLTITDGSNNSTFNGAGVANGPDPGVNCTTPAAGSLTLNQVNVTGNDDSATGGVSAGGVYNCGTMTITSNSSVSRNTATGTFCNGGILNDLGTMTISANSIVTGNVCTGESGTGGIGNANGARLLMYQSSVTNNAAPDEGNGGGIWSDGYLYMNGVTITGNVAGSSAAGGDGGGLFVTAFFAAVPNDGVATIVGGLIAYNAAYDPPKARGNGGGIFVNDGATLNMSGSGGVDYNNASNCGGGIYVNGTPSGGTLNQTTVEGNEAGSADGGGGTYDTRSGLTINSNAVVSHNKVDGSYTASGANEVFDGSLCGIP